MQKLNEKIVLKEAISQLNKSQSNLFTGKLTIIVEKQRWRLYFRLGRIIWATGGADSYERWQRHINLFCPELSQQELKQIASEYKPSEEYDILASLYEREDSTQKQNLIELVNSVVREVIFDVIQCDALSSDRLSYNIDANETPDSMFTLVDTDRVIEEVVSTWQAWQNAELSAYSPNLYPVIEKPKILEQGLSTQKYRQIIGAIDGTKTLRALAIETNKDVVSLAKSLLPLVNADAILFSSLPTPRKIKLPKTPDAKKLSSLDSSSKNSVVSPPPEPSTPKDTSKPLVACIDDSPVVCKALGHLITSQGYRFIAIQDSLKAMLVLLNTKPNLIFLDVSMPVINGYDLCTHLRKNPGLQDVPIVIVTDKDRLVDRIKAKLVGGTAFISKPVTRGQVLEMLHKHLKVQR